MPRSAPRCLLAALCLCIALLAARLAGHLAGRRPLTMAPPPPPVDIITLDNFADKLPKWHPGDASHLHALVDMGSNGIRFSISDLAPPRTRLLPCVYRERAGISLFDALTPMDSSGATTTLALPDATIREVARTLARFQRIARAFGVPPAHTAVFATEAMRRAANAGTLLDAIADAAPGLAVHVLAPEVETLFGSIGARATFATVGGDSSGGLMLDLGGGSVQMSYIDPRLGTGYEVAAAGAGQSMPYGAARLTRLATAERAGENGSGLGVLAAAEAADADVRATTAAAPRLADDMAAALARLQATFPSLAAAATNTATTGIDVYLCGGGFRGYGSMLMYTDAVQPYPVPLMGGYTVAGAAFCDTQAMRRTNHAAADSKIYGLSKRRRHQFAAIAAVVDALVVALQRSNHTIRSVTFCAGGNREGALMMRLPPAVREADPLAVMVEARKPRSDAVKAVAAALRATLPPTHTRAPAWAPLQPLLPLIAAHIWDRAGADAAANAAFALHDAVVCDPGIPGLTHQVRALLAVSQWARWGGGVAPADASLLDGLRQLLRRRGDAPGGADANADADLLFWA